MTGTPVVPPYYWITFCSPPTGGEVTSAQFVRGFAEAVPVY